MILLKMVVGIVCLIFMLLIACVVTIIFFAIEKLLKRYINKIPVLSKDENRSKLVAALYVVAMLVTIYVVGDTIISELGI